jgi:hypothetical protein
VSSFICKNYELVLIRGLVSSHKIVYTQIGIYLQNNFKVFTVWVSTSISVNVLINVCDYDEYIFDMNVYNHKC